MAILRILVDSFTGGHQAFVADLNRSYLAASVIILFFFIAETLRVARVAFPLAMLLDDDLAEANFHY